MDYPKIQSILSYRIENAPKKASFEPIYVFMENPEEHKLKFLEPRVDFFKKHPSQVTQYNGV